MKKDFIVRRSIEIIDEKPHVCTILEKELVKCKYCEYSFIEAYKEDGKTHVNILCEKHPELGSLKEDWFCADAWKA